ncbi:MAG: hypothetical protein JWQ04_1951, partial [Pedosphaera sp.]|nr:hypothetical protein [Pedosphaera sp.]
MLAIINSWGTKPTKSHQLRKNLGYSVFDFRRSTFDVSLYFGLVACLLAACLGLTFPVLAQYDSSHIKPPSDKAEFARHAEKVFNAAKTRFESQPNDPEAAWQFGRACYDWADFATSNTQREDIAKQGIAACRALIERDPNSVPGHYYLSLNLGQLAQTRNLGALKIVGQMEAEFRIALGLDPKLDYAGSDRGLGLLYLETPGWPVSIGSKS